MSDPTTPDTVPVAGLSIWDPIFLGLDEDGVLVSPTLIYRNILVAGEPGSGKSVLLNDIVAHAALSPDCRLWLFDGKRVELGMWREVADVFVPNNMAMALTRLRELQSDMDHRYAVLESQGRRKISRSESFPVKVVVIDELAYYTTSIGDRREQEDFIRLVRDLVARGRAAGIIMIVATQRPSADIIPTSLRDLFGYRCAFRCTTVGSSDVILGHGLAAVGYDASLIAPEDLGVALLRGEGGIPKRIKAAYLTDNDITELARLARWLRIDRGVA